MESHTLDAIVTLLSLKAEPVPALSNHFFAIHHSICNHLSQMFLLLYLPDLVRKPRISNVAHMERRYSMLLRYRNQCVTKRMTTHTVYNTVINRNFNIIHL